MLRTLLCTLLAFALFADLGVADEAKQKRKAKKKAGANAGEIVRVDAEKGTITVKVGAKKKQIQEKEFRVTDKTAVTATTSGNTTALKAAKVAELLKKEQFRTGAYVAVETEDGTTAKAITFSAAPEAKQKKKKTAAANAGEIVRVDAEKGTVTVKVGARKKAQERVFRVTEQTTVTAVAGTTKTELKSNTVAALLKREQFRTGAQVSVETETDGTTAKAITFGAAPEAKKKKKKAIQ